MSSSHTPKESSQKDRAKTGSEPVNQDNAKSELRDTSVKNGNGKITEEKEPSQKIVK